MDYAKVSQQSVADLALVYTSHKVVLKKSDHSFTGYVLHCYFRDEMITHFVHYLEDYIGIFIAVRYVNQEVAYASVPVVID